MKKSFEQLIRKQDLYYNHAGKDWRDGILLGNGNLGIMAYAPAHLEWVINKVDIFDPSVEKALLEKRISHADFLQRIEKMKRKNTLFLNELEKAHASRQDNIRNTISAAVIRLRFWHGTGWSAPATPETNQHLSLFDGILEEQMNAHFFHPKARMFVPRNTGLFCIRVSEPGCPERPLILDMVRPANFYFPQPCWKEVDSVISFTQKLPGGRHSYAVAFTFSHGEKMSRQLNGNAIQWEHHGECDLFFSIKSSYECLDPLAEAKAEALAAREKTFDGLEAEHRKWWNHYWDNAYADFGKETRIQKYFTFSLYELASSFGKAPMPGLNGLSFGPLDEQTPGVGYQGYTHDQNAQLPALPFFPLNRVDFVHVLADTYLNIRKTLRHETKRLFGCDGIFLPLTMNQFGLEYPTKAYRYTICGSAYTGMILSFAWRYSRNRALLKEKIYPLLREFVIFYVSLLHKSEDGIYHLDWSVPPEIFTLTRDENATVSMLKVCLETLVETAGILHRDRKHLPLWRDILEHYPPVCKTLSGAFWCGPDVPSSHYFYGGHLLYPFFPTGISSDSESARITLDLIENEAIERSFADCSGQWHLNHEWSHFLTTCTYLRAGESQKGWLGIQRFLDLFAKENGLFSHDPILIASVADSENNARQNAKRLSCSRQFCDGTILTEDNQNIPHPVCVTSNPMAKRLAPAVLEGNSTFLFMVAETLLQSHGGVFRLFPGVPVDFTGSFVRFLAEGGFEVSSSMENGKVLWVEIHALHGGNVRLINPFRKNATEISIVLLKGETLKITPETVIKME
jgi:hypothetical protein